MIIPLVSSLSEDVLSAVPRGLREAAYGLGATKFEVSTRIVLPAALSGVFASFILAISRAVGETMAVVLAAGMRSQITLNPLTSIETMTTYIVQVIGGDASYGEPKYLSLFAVGLTLFAVTLDVEHHLRTRLAALSGGLSMSLPKSLGFTPIDGSGGSSGRSSGRPAWRRPAWESSSSPFSWARSWCAALQGPPDHPWYAIGPTSPSCSPGDPAGDPHVAQGPLPAAGISGRDRRQPVAAGSGRPHRHPDRDRRGVYLEEYCPAGPAAADHSDQHRQPGRCAVDRLRHPRAWLFASAPSASRASRWARPCWPAS